MGDFIRRREMLKHSESGSSGYVENGLIERYILYGSENKWSNNELAGELGSGVNLISTSATRFGSKKAPSFDTYGYVYSGCLLTGVTVSSFDISEDFTVGFVYHCSNSANIFILVNGTNYSGYISNIAELGTVNYGRYVNGTLFFVVNADGTIYGYCNGVLVRNSDTVNMSTVLANGMIASAPSNTDDRLSIGEMIIYNRALTAQEIAENHSYATTLPYYIS